jgi:type IV pilus biogenesis protein CpaD/CtpE
MALRTYGLAALLLLAAGLAGCDQIDPYTRSGVWRPIGANEVNLRAMVANPADLANGVDAGGEDGQLSTAAVERLRLDKVKALPDSGVAQLNVVATGGRPAGGQ